MWTKAGMEQTKRIKESGGGFLEELLENYEHYFKGINYMSTIMCKRN